MGEDGRPLGRLFPSYRHGRIVTSWGRIETPNRKTSDRNQQFKLVEGFGVRTSEHFKFNLVHTQRESGPGPFFIRELMISN